MRRAVFFFVIFSFQTILSQSITLRDTTNQYDYIIITVPEFVTSCEAFKQHKETVRDFRTLIVDTTQIFAEFDSSETGQDNIRDFISYAGTFWKNPRPKYFLIAGSVQFVPNFNIPPGFGNPHPYHQSDFYYSQNIYENDSTTTDFYVGRIPAKNTGELGNYFEKVIDYESNQQLQSWMNNSLFICEDDIGFDFLGGAMNIASHLPSYIRYYYIFEIDTSVFFGNKDSIYNVINNKGISILWFEGHSSEHFLIDPEYFNLNDLNGLENSSKYFLSLFPITQGAILDTNTNISNELLYLENAGSIGAAVVNGYSYWGAIKSYQREWASRIYDNNYTSIAEVIDVLPVLNGLYYYMKQVINLWADPSIKLKYDVTVDINDSEMELPITFTLDQNYPNPFNPSTNIKYQISESGFVSLKVYDVLGNEIVSLVNKEKPAGNYKVEVDGTNLTSGVYFYQLRAGNFVETKKMIFMK